MSINWMKFLPNCSWRFNEDSFVFRDLCKAGLQRLWQLFTVDASVRRGAAGTKKHRDDLRSCATGNLYTCS